MDKRDRCRIGISKNECFSQCRNRHSWGEICWILNSTPTIYWPYGPKIEQIKPSWKMLRRMEKLRETFELQVGLRPDISIKPSNEKVMWPSTRRTTLVSASKTKDIWIWRREGNAVRPTVKGRRRGRKIEVEGHAEDTCLHPRARQPLDSCIILV